MRILFVDTTPDCVLARAALVTTGHHVEVAEPSAAKPLHDALSQSWDVLVIEAAASELVLESLGRLAPPSEDPTTFIVASLKATPSTVEAAFKAGAEDFFRKPFVLEQVRGRIERIAHQRQCLAVAASRGALASRGATAKITALRAWNGFQGLAAEAVSGITLLSLVVTKAPVEHSPWMTSTLLLAAASDQLACRIIVDGDHRSLEAMADAAVGSRDAAAVADLLGEIANNAGGAFMRGAGEEDIVFTAGLPAPADPTEMDRQLGCVDQMVVCWLSDPASGAALRVRLGVRVRRNSFVRIAAIREGMVLVADLRGPEGGILLPAGTRVTLSTAERVRRMLDARRLVEVADAA